MNNIENENLTQLLIQYSSGDEAVLDSLLPHIYQELRRLAESYMRREAAHHTLQPTALVHEAYFKLIDQNRVQWQNRSHFFGVAAQLMRRILIDHARKRKASKRGGSQIRLSFDDGIQVAGTDNTRPDLIALEEAMERLEALSPRQAKVVELRYFGGLNIEETAEVLKTSPATVKRDWSMAKSWLFREIKDGIGNA